jgi:hypothetical protein
MCSVQLAAYCIQQCQTFRIFRRALRTSARCACSTRSRLSVLETAPRVLEDQDPAIVAISSHPTSRQVSLAFTVAPGRCCQWIDNGCGRGHAAVSADGMPLTPPPEVAPDCMPEQASLEGPLPDINIASINHDYNSFSRGWHLGGKLEAMPLLDVPLNELGHHLVLLDGADAAAGIGSPGSREHM